MESRDRTLRLPAPLILASGSPRRKLLLKILGIPFRIVVPEVREEEPKCTVEDPEAIARTNAWQKGHAVWSRSVRKAFVVAADTIVYLPDQKRILSKPSTKQEAFNMLKILSGKTHIVYTAVYLGIPDIGIDALDGDMERETVWVERAQVTFHTLSDEEICYYVQMGAPMDKAGAYGAQDWIGITAIREIQGNFYTVMGLPVHSVWQRLKRWVIWSEAKSEAYADGIATSHSG